MLGARPGGAPFPGAGTESTHEVLLPGRRTWQRFGENGKFRDTPFAVVFCMQLLAVITIAIANGIGVTRAPELPP